MFKVLDIRELKYAISEYSHGLSVQRDKHEYVAICEELETGTRKRFTFCEGWKNRGYAGNYHYEGYQGDYNLLVIGDIFEIEPTSTYDKVVIVN